MKKKVLVMFMALLFAAMGSACKVGEKIDPNDPQKLEIYLYNAGYGYKWCEDILNAFKQEEWVKEKYPELKTSFTKDELDVRASELINAPKRVNKFEVIMGTNLEKNLSPSNQVMELTESVYNSKVPGEDILFKDKMITSYLTSAAYNDAGGGTDNKYYGVNWASGMTGLIYNEDKLSALGMSVPNTTDELVKIMQDVKALSGSNSSYNETYSFVTYTASAYAYYLYYTWWAQYQTTSEYINFYNGIDSETNSLSSAVFSQIGRLRSLEALESFMYKDKGLMWLNPNTGREAYRETQNKVLRGTGLFMANGDWVDNELEDFRQGLIELYGRVDTVKMMRTPVLSSIIERTDIPDDATLSGVISAIDAGETSYNGVSADDFATILAARKVVYSLGPMHNAAIPEYASGKEVAIDFLRYLATDKANELYIKATNGASLPFQYDVKVKNPQLFNTLSPMQKGRLEYFADLNIDILPAANSFPLARFGGLSAFASKNPMTEFTSGSSKEGYSSVAERLFRTEINYWTDNNNLRWKNCLEQAGL